MNNLQLHDIKYLYLILMIIKQIDLTHRRDPNRYYHPGLELTLEER